MASQATLFDVEQIDRVETEPEIPLNPTVPEAAKPRLGAQHREILARLRQGPATNRELLAIGQRFGARIHELRGAGYDIRRESVSDAKGVYEYRLMKEAL